MLTTNTGTCCFAMIVFLYLMAFLLQMRTCVCVSVCVCFCVCVLLCVCISVCLCVSSSFTHLIIPFIHFLRVLTHSLRQGFSVQHWLSWNSLYSVDHADLELRALDKSCVPPCLALNAKLRWILLSLSVNPYWLLANITTTSPSLYNVGRSHSEPGACGFSNTSRPASPGRSAQPGFFTKGMEI
jgi:hypothetical protein